MLLFLQYGGEIPQYSLAITEHMTKAAKTTTLTREDSIVLLDIITTLDFPRYLAEGLVRFSLIYILFLF